MASTPTFIIIVCITFAAVVCSIIFARPMARWLKQHSER